MHPKWQQVLVERLKRIFPNTQIIASTHSPLVVGGLKVSEVVRFVRDGAGDVVMAPLDQEMLFGRPDQLLTGGLFDLDTWLDATTREVTERYRKLLGTTHRTEEQEREFQKLRRIVRVRVPMSPTTPPERLAQEIIHTVLKEQVGDEVPNAVQDVQARVSQLLDEVQKQQSQNRA
jgi:hypothetical protein